MAIETILLAVGPMDTVRADGLAETVSELAVPLDADVVIGHAFTADEYESVRERLGFDERPDAVDPDAVAAHRAPVADLRDRLEDEGVDVTVRGRLGEIGPGVVELATEIGADRIVVGGRRRSPAEKAVLGSVSQEIILAAPCPVTYYRDLDVME